MQRLLKANISALDDNLLVLAEEFSEWESGKRSIDLLCIDRDARVVVIELKRTEDGGHMELQALRYAAMVSNMTLERASEVLARSLGGEDAIVRARAEIREFLDIDALTDRPGPCKIRIILASADFSTEVTTTVLWLNDQGLDITCIRMRPYKLGDTLLLDVTQVIPLPGAEDYLVRVREQVQDERRAEGERQGVLRRFWTQFIDRSRTRTALFANRTATKDHWLSAGIGRSGFWITVALTKDVGRVEVFLRIPGDEGARTTQAFEDLFRQKDAIERRFGQALDWQPLPDRAGSRICCEIPGGWKAEEATWPEFQDSLIDLAIRLDAALRGPIQALVLPASSGDRQS